MVMKTNNTRKGYFEQMALRVTAFAGSNKAFFGAVAVVLLWICSGPIFGFSDTWQLVINTGTTIVTFLIIALAVFMLVRAINRMYKKPAEVTADTKPCPFCTMTVARAATRCPNCTSQLAA